MQTITIEVKDNYTVNVLEMLHGLKEDEAWDDL